MGELGGGASGKPAPRFRKAAGILVSGLVLFAPAFSPAAIAADNVARPVAGDNIAPAVRPPAAAADNTAAIRDAISRTITSYENDIRDAYHRELLKHPKIEGEITVSFTVRPEGDITDVKVERSTLNWPPLEAEILSRIKAWKFPPFEGEPIPAHVPYQFGRR